MKMIATKQFSIKRFDHSKGNNTSSSIDNFGDIDENDNVYNNHLPQNLFLLLSLLFSLQFLIASDGIKDSLESEKFIVERDCIL